jgi:hypothetical protein
LTQRTANKIANKTMRIVYDIRTDSPGDPRRFVPIPTRPATSPLS